jgi:hypothetical protein
LQKFLVLSLYLYIFWAQSTGTPAAQVEKPFWETETVPDKLVKRYERRLPFFAPIDANRDWILQQTEIEASILRRFRRYDVNSNGLWDAGELALHQQDFINDREEVYGALADTRIKRYRLRIEQADKDEDGNLSWKEYYTFYRDRFYRMDSNGDNNVEYREYRLIDDKLSPAGGVDTKQIDVPEYK